MDADTRHQLKQNEFAEALSHLRDFSDKRTLAWIAVIVVIALGYAGYRYLAWQHERELTDAFQTLANARPAVADPAQGDAALSRIRQFITENKDPELVAWSRLELGVALVARAEGEDAATKLDQAEQEFQAVLRMPVDAMIFKAPAMYRLGSLYETRREFDQAREMYTKLVNDTELAGSPFIELANARLGKLDELSTPVTFQPGVKPLPPPASEPASAPASGPTVRRIPSPFQPPPAAAVPATQPAPAEEPAETPTAEPPRESDEPQQP